MNENEKKNSTVTIGSKVTGVEKIVLGPRATLVRETGSSETTEGSAQGETNQTHLGEQEEITIAKPKKKKSTKLKKNA